MSEFNFKATEDARPGSGVYKIGNLGGGSTKLTIRQAEYPTIDLSTLTKNNFFLRTTCNASAVASVTNSKPCNIRNDYYGGSVSLAYKYSNGEGTITVSETQRKAYQVKYLEGEDYSETKSGSYSHRVYMTRSPIIY